MSRAKKTFVDETLSPTTKPVRASFVEQELYVEPTQMGTRDTLGVVVALIALAVIGISGYVWLNPKLDAHNFMAFGKKPDMQVATEPGAAAEHIACPYCGMYADSSASTVSAMFEGGGSGTFDSFDCLFNYMKENNVKLDSATVRDYEAQGDDKMIDVNDAMYLYDTTAEVSGSMQPYVASFVSRAKAEEARKTMGGEVMDFAGLKGKWK